MTERTLEWDWYAGTIPENVVVADSAYIETTFSFHLYRSERDVGVEYGHGAATYLGTMFDVGPRGQVRLGRYALVHGARFICDREVDIGDHATISWNTVFMDSYRVPLSVAARRQVVTAANASPDRRLVFEDEARPIRVEPNVWVGFDAVLLPGVTIGEGSIVGAKSVVYEDVPPYTIVAGNPARTVRPVPRPEGAHAR